jgi:A/G-specific adenine glycosylase
LDKRQNQLKYHKIQEFQEKLIDWYQKNHRKLPWRDTRDPYRIWVSEVMLQQTQVKKVLAYYEKFIRRFPNVYNLSKARLQSVLKVWELMGYYARARNLHKASKLVVNLYNGQIPNNYTQIKKLPGVGEYIAAAVTSIAFSAPHPVLDGNVKRVLARLHLIDAPINKENSKKIFIKKIDEILDKRDPGKFNQAIMELGAVICKPIDPRCSVCPVSQFCLARIKTLQKKYPVRIKKAPIPRHHISVGIVQKNGKILITRRQDSGLLGGLWEFPGGKINKGENPEQACQREIFEEVMINIEISNHLKQIKHAYTHFQIVMEIFLCNYLSGRIRLKSASDYRWINISDIDKYPFPGANHKFIPLLKEIFSS